MSKESFVKGFILISAISVIGMLYMGTILGCKKTPIDPPSPTIEGEWRDLIQGTPNYVYHFDNGLLIQTAMIGNSAVVVQQYTYAVRQDTVYIGGNEGTPARLWKYRFELDSLMEVKDITPGVQISKLSWLIKT